jgi:hypothetical protein
MLTLEDKVQRWIITVLSAALLVLVLSMAGCRPESPPPPDPHQSVPDKVACRWSNGERADCVSAP